MLMACIPSFCKDTTAKNEVFNNTAAQAWLTTIFQSMVRSAIARQSSNDWLAEHLKEYDIQLFNAGYDATGLCFTQAFGLLNSD